MKVLLIFAVLLISCRHESDPNACHNHVNSWSVEPFAETTVAHCVHPKATPELRNGALICICPEVPK